MLNERGETVGRAEITLLNDPGLTLDARALDQILVELVALLLGDDRAHIG